MVTSLNPFGLVLGSDSSSVIENHANTKKLTPLPNWVVPEGFPESGFEGSDCCRVGNDFPCQQMVDGSEIHVRGFRDVALSPTVRRLNLSKLAREIRERLDVAGGVFDERTRRPLPSRGNEGGGHGFGASSHNPHHAAPHGLIGDFPCQMSDMFALLNTQCLLDQTISMGESWQRSHTRGVATNSIGVTT